MHRSIEVADRIEVFDSSPLPKQCVTTSSPDKVLQGIVGLGDAAGALKA